MNEVVLTGYLAREVEVEQHRGGHLMGRTLLLVPRGRQGRGPSADLVPIVVRGRARGGGGGAGVGARRAGGAGGGGGGGPVRGGGGERGPGRGRPAHPPAG